MDLNNMRDVQPILDSIEVLKLKPVSFVMKDGKKTQFGFVAQDIEETELRNIIFKDSRGFRSVAYNQVIPLLLHRIQALEERIANLEGFVGKYMPIG